MTVCGINPLENEAGGRAPHTIRKMTGRVNCEKLHRPVIRGFRGVEEKAEHGIHRIRGSTLFMSEDGAADRI